MKIRPDQIDALKQQEQIGKKPRSDETGKFEAVLAQEVQKSSGTESAQQAAQVQSVAGTQGIDPLLAVQEAAKTESASPEERIIMERIDTLLNTWENYADNLGAPKSEESLREAYGVLEHISNEVEDLKQTDMDHPNLRSMVDELEILTLTEQFKFNRGDYL